MKFSIVSALLAAGVSAQKLESLLGQPGLLGLTAVLKQYPALTQTLASANGITILAPADTARGLFALKSPIPGAVEATLTYHVLKGAIPSSSIPQKAFVETLLTNANYSSVAGGQKLQVEKSAKGVVFTSGGGATSKVIKADIKFDGGYIHLIDAVLTPPKTIASTAAAAGLTSLSRALVKEGLLDTVEGLKGVTIFAPTNAAFFKAGKTLNELSEADLAAALKYHVVPGVAFSTNLQPVQQVPTVNGKPVTVKAQGANVLINNAKVVKADILIKNGVIHVIDSVLLPPA